MSKLKTGTIVQISGPVVDVEFQAGHLPKMKEALTVERDGVERVMEVAQHVGENTVRCIMLSGSVHQYLKLIKVKLKKIQRLLLKKHKPSG